MQKRDRQVTLAAHDCPEGYRTAGVRSSRDMLLLSLDAAEDHTRRTIADVADEEYAWEPLSESERVADLQLPPHTKRVWRVFQQRGVWVYDYTPEPLSPPPFTTIAWIMNHMAQTADMYLYCVQTGIPEGVDRSWDDLPVPANREAMAEYIVQALASVREYLLSVPQRRVNPELNRLTPAPWGEMRPTCLNIWGGVVEHVLQHAMQIAARKDRIRYGY